MTRIAQAGWETRNLMEADVSGGSSVADNTQARSGSFSFRVAQNNNQYLGWNVSLDEFYAGLGIYHAGANQSTADILTWWASGTELGSIRMNRTANTVAAYVGSNLVATGTAVITASSWVQIEIYVKIADSGGRIVVKVDGVTDIDYTGDTKPGAAAAADQVQLIGNNLLRYWNNYCYIDDFVLNSADGAEDNSWPGLLRFIPFFPSGNGATSGLMGSDGNQTDNYLLVDDLATGANDGDTTYVAGDAADEKDTYGMTDPTLPEGTIDAVIVCALARKTNSGVATQLATVCRSGSSEVDSADLDLPTSYGLVQNRYTADPDGGGAWTGAAVNACEMGVKARGAFA